MGRPVSNPRGLNATLRGEWSQALLFRELARLRADLPLFDNVDCLKWQGPTPAFEALGRRLDAAKVSKAKRETPRAAAPKA